MQNYYYYFNSYCNPIWSKNTKMSSGTLPQQKLKTSGLASTGSGRSTVSWFAGGLRSADTLEVGNCRRRRQPRGFCWETKWTLNHRGSLATESLAAPAHLHLPLPPPLALTACQLPSASPLWCSGRNFTAAVSLLFVHAREKRTRAHSQECPQCTQAWAHGAKTTSKASKQAGGPGRTVTCAVGKRCHSASISAN